MNTGINSPLGVQCQLLEEIIRKNAEVFHVIETFSRFNLNNAYVCAGCIFQTVWNYLSGFDVNHGINDIDIIYFDGSDLSSEAENEIIHKINGFYSGIGYKLDINNEARVHLWYEKEFGFKIPPYSSSEHAINTWMSTSAIGVTYNENKLQVYAPYGLNDMYGKIIRPNKLLLTKEQYEYKAKKWQSTWTDVTILDW